MQIGIEEEDILCARADVDGEDAHSQRLS